MELDLNPKWKKLVDDFEKDLEMRPDLQAIIFLIGVRELGMGYQKFTKDEKINVMHIAICALLEPYGYYKLVGNDPEGWPHYELIQQIPILTQEEQETFMKKAILEYFDY